jgi:PAS domain S-box-containing protein
MPCHPALESSQFGGRRAALAARDTKGLRYLPGRQLARTRSGPGLARILTTGTVTAPMSAEPLSPPAASALLGELKSYLRFTGEDARILAELRPIALPAFPALADEFYAAIRLHPAALAVLRDEAQARRLHASLQIWLGELLSGTYDEAYVVRHWRIGQAHVRVGLPQHYMVTAMRRIEESLRDLAADAFHADAKKLEEASLAIGRVCGLDLAIMLDSYRRDLLERAARLQALERDALETRLTERRRVLDDALEVADVAVLEVDAEGSLLLFNKKAQELTGYAHDEVIGSDPFERFFGDRARSVRERFLSVKAGAPLAVDADLVTRAGAVRCVAWRVASHQSSELGSPTLVVVGMDVSEQRELERRARQNERLAAAGVLAAGLAHEIRNPLNGAGLHLSILERSLARLDQVPREAVTAVEVVRFEIGRLSSLVTEFLEVARPVPLAIAEHDLNPVAEGVAATMASEAGVRRARLKVEPCPHHARGRFDAERIEHALLNLVRNAIESVRDAGEVVIRVRRTAQFLEVDVEDDGPGFDPAEPVFDAFYTTKNGGTGLGLSVVQRVVTDHGGDIRFTTEPGCTVFTLRLPL